MPLPGLLRARRGLLLGLVVLLVAGVVGAAWWWTRAPAPAWEQAVRLAPADTERVAFTRWSAVREQVGDPGTEQELLDAAYDRDLSSTSALLSSSPGLDQLFGFSPATLDWEALAQGPSGALLVLQLDEPDLDDVRERISALGFTEPDEADGVWAGGPDVLAASGADITPELQYLALDEESGRVLASDNGEFLGRVLRQSTNLSDDGPAGVRQVVEAVGDSAGDPVSGVLYTPDHACASLAMGQADDADQSTARGLVREAGGVDPYTGFALTAQEDGTFRAAMAFEDAATARRNADARTALASGEAPGQGGSFSDRFTVGEAGADGEVVQLQLEPVEGAFVLSDLSSGPVLFASC